MRRKIYQDPYWTEARFASRCGCGQHDIAKGEKIFYYPSTKTPYGGKCAEAAAHDMNAAAFDEAQYNGGY